MQNNCASNWKCGLTTQYQLINDYSPSSLQVAKSGEAASLSECFLLAGADSDPPYTWAAGNEAEEQSPPLTAPRVTSGERKGREPLRPTKHILLTDLFYLRKDSFLSANFNIMGSPTELNYGN